MEHCLDVQSRNTSLIQQNRGIGLAHRRDGNEPGLEWENMLPQVELVEQILSEGVHRCCDWVEE